MKQFGQAFGVFKLVVFAIVALALIYLVGTFFIEQKPNPIEELNRSLDFAESHLGTGITDQILFENQFAVNAKNVFDSPQRSVSFKCHALECTQKNLEVRARIINANDTTSIRYTTRCIFEKNLFNCKIYFGTPPAQLLISGVDLKDNYDLEKERIKLKFFVKNSGQQNAVDISTEVKIFIKGTQDEKEVENLYTEPLVESTELLTAQTSTELEFELPITGAGEYVVEIKTSGMEAGEDKKRIEFSAIGSIILTNCKAEERLETYLSETLNQCITRYSCTDCKQAFECKAVWDDILPGTIFEISSKELALEINEPIEGTCN